MQRPSKLARLPRPILKELNQRLDRAEPAKHILLWLNPLPEVQAILQAEFNSQPVSRQNLADWKKSSRFRNWQLLQAALEFTQESLPEELGPPEIEKLASNLIRCLQLRFAALASKLFGPAEDPQAELHLLGRLCSELALLRRSDLSAARLALQREHLALEQAKSQQDLDRQFWEWTKRPDIRKALFPEVDRDKSRLAAVRLLDEHLLGVKRVAPVPAPASTPTAPAQPSPEPSPSAK